jgi:hypothetical protein
MRRRASPSGEEIPSIRAENSWVEVYFKAARARQRPDTLRHGDPPSRGESGQHEAKSQLPLVFRHDFGYRRRILLRMILNNEVERP